MNYLTFPPHEELSHWVKFYWTLDGPAESTPEIQTIVPDGCIEMIFHYGDLYRQYLKNGESLIQPRCFVFGQITEPLLIQATGRTGIISVRFLPDGFRAFSGIKITDLDNRAVSLTDLYGEEALAIENEILKADSAEKRIVVVERFLKSLLKEKKVIDVVIKETIETILSAHGQLSVETLTSYLGISRRQLERRFHSAVGMSPKQLSKVIRLQSALKQLINKEFTSLTALAYDGDFYDQAHFNKDFKELTGYTPKDFYGNNLKMTALFYSKE